MSVKIQEKSYKRYLLLAVAAIVNFPAGSAAIWSIFQPYVMDIYGIDNGSANLPFSVFMAGFVAGNILGGRLMQRWKPRALVLAGSGLLGVGFLLSAFVPLSMPWLLSVTYGILGGVGGGMSYNVILAAMAKWFPDKKGMAAGIMVFLVGANGFIMSPICNRLLAKYGFSQTAMAVAVFYLVIVLAGSWAIQEAPEKTDTVCTENSGTQARDYTAGEMIRTKEFYMVAGAMAFSMTAYFMINPMVKSLGMERGLTDMMAVTTVMMISISNCAARLTIPWLSDRLGRKIMLLFLFILTMGTVLGLIVARGPLYMVLAAALGFTYGGFFGIFPVVAAEQFGTKNSGLNYGIIMIGYGLISLICPILVTIGVTVSFVIAAVTCFSGMLLILCLERRNRQRTVI